MFFSRYRPAVAVLRIWPKQPKQLSAEAAKDSRSSYPSKLRRNSVGRTSLCFFRPVIQCKSTDLQLSIVWTPTNMHGPAFKPCVKRFPSKIQEWCTLEGRKVTKHKLTYPKLFFDLVVQGHTLHKLLFYHPRNDPHFGYLSRLHRQNSGQQIYCKQQTSFIAMQTWRQVAPRPQESRLGLLNYFGPLVICLVDHA